MLYSIPRLFGIAISVGTTLGLCIAAQSQATQTQTPATKPASQPATKPAGKVDPKPVNENCLVETDQPIDSSNTVVYQGKTYGFCCHDCMKKFNADPERYLAGK